MSTRAGPASLCNACIAGTTCETSPAPPSTARWNTGTPPSPLTAIPVWICCLSSHRVLATSNTSGEDLVEVEISEDGAIRILVTRLSEQMRDGQVIFDVAAAILIRRLVGLTLAVADQSGHFGSWALAVGATASTGCELVAGAAE